MAVDDDDGENISNWMHIWGVEIWIAQKWQIFDSNLICVFQEFYLKSKDIVQKKTFNHTVSCLYFNGQQLLSPLKKKLKTNAK